MPEDEEGLTWERRLAKKYYDKLFKEYAITDLSRYKENKVCSGPLLLQAIQQGGQLAYTPHLRSEHYWQA